MRIRSRLAWAFALVALLALVLVLAGVNLGMYWSLGHVPGLDPFGGPAVTGGGRGALGPGAMMEPGAGFGPGPRGRGEMPGPMGLLGRGVIGTLLTWSLVAGVTAVILAALIGWWLAGRTARPLAELVNATQKLGLRDMALRVYEPDTGDEVAELARGFNRMAARLHREDQARRQMLADVAHELRHPVAVLQSQMELLQDGVRPLTSESLAGVQDEVLRLGHLIGDLQDLSLAEAGALSLNRQTVAPADVLESLIAYLAPVAEEKGVALALAVAPDAPAVLADPQRLRQVLVNLLSNALRYTPAGGRVTVSAAATPAGWLGVTVADTGAGIAPDDLPHVFDRFYRADRSRSRQGGGAGLGLAIARSLVRLHDGTIRAESSLGQGSRFTVELPPA